MAIGLTFTILLIIFIIIEVFRSCQYVVTSPDIGEIINSHSYQ